MTTSTSMGGRRNTSKHILTAAVVEAVETLLMAVEDWTQEYGDAISIEQGGPVDQINWLVATFAEGLTAVLETGDMQRRP